MNKEQLLKELKVYPKTELPRESKDDSTISVDVIVYEDTLLNIGYYDYELKQWSFHTETLKDMKDVDFVWMYAPKTLIGKADL